MNNNELKHYGVLGMKWGVRRTPEQLGRRTIPKGTKMYRATVDSNESTSGSKYVTYLKVDRDMYKGRYADVLRDNNKVDTNTPIYEKQYVLKKDIKIPSREELKDVVNEAVNDAKTKKVMQEGAAEVNRIILTRPSFDLIYDMEQVYGEEIYSYDRKTFESKRVEYGKKNRR